MEEQIIYYSYFLLIESIARLCDSDRFVDEFLFDW